MAYVSKYVEVEVEVDVDDVIEGLSKKEKTELAAKLLSDTSGVPFGIGDGDVARAENVVERAYAAARNLSNLPREIADLFWVVHGRAI